MTYQGQLKKGFINYVFCRNWAVRNPAGTRLDSSLVNKQVGGGGATVVGGCSGCGDGGVVSTGGVFQRSYEDLAT